MPRLDIGWPHESPWAGGTRLHWLAVGSLHRYRCHGFAIFLWRYSQADYREWVPQYVPSSSPALENRALPAQPGLATVQAAAVDTASPQASGSGSERTGRRGADHRRPVARVDAAASVDDARSRNRGQGIEQLKAAGTDGPRHANAPSSSRHEEKWPASLPRLPTESTAHIGASTAADCHPTRKPVLTQQSPQAKGAAAGPTQLQPMTVVVVLRRATEPGRIKTKTKLQSREALDQYGVSHRQSGKGCYVQVRSWHL